MLVVCGVEGDVITSEREWLGREGVTVNVLLLQERERR